MSYYGGDFEKLRVGQPGYLRNELHLSAETKIVGMVAFMYAPKRYLGQKRGLKGHEDLIDAFKICLAKDQNLRCVIVGGAWNHATEYEEAIRQYARKQCDDNVIFHIPSRDSRHHPQ